MAHRVTSREDWLTQRRALLELEKDHKRKSDELAKRRRELPWVELSEDYRFVGPEGEVGLAALFGGHSQLVVYHLMFGPDWSKPCPSCSFWADHFDGSREHLARRDVRLVAVSRAPREMLVAAAARAQWTFPWYSSEGTSFNHDFHVTFEKGSDPEASYNFRAAPDADGEMPGVSAFAKDGDRIFHTYSAYARGLEPMNATYGILDFAPRGRDEEGLDWPMSWVQRLADVREIAGS